MSKIVKLLVAQLAAQWMISKLPPEEQTALRFGALALHALAS